MSDKKHVNDDPGLSRFEKGKSPGTTKPDGGGLTEGYKPVAREGDESGKKPLPPPKKP